MFNCKERKERRIEISEKGEGGEQEKEKLKEKGKERTRGGGNGEGAKYRKRATTGPCLIGTPYRVLGVETCKRERERERERKS